MSKTDSFGTSVYYSWYTVFLCMVAYVFSFIDRQIIALLIEPIQADLQISDTQFSLLHGLAFAIFYALMGIPIARLADSSSRPLIIAVGIFLWSVATALCGLAKSFWQLFVARMCVGVGEAALSPASYSMISDLFPKSRLGLALSIFSLGPFIGTALAFLIGGTAIDWIGQYGGFELPFVGHLQPWQLTFFIVGLPGILISILFILTIRDPERKGVNKESKNGFSIREILMYMSGNKYTFSSHYIGFGVLALTLYAFLSWGPAFLIRNYGLSSTQVGIYLGLTVLISNSTGVLASGWLTDFFSRRGYINGSYLAGAIGGLGVIIPGALFSLVHDLYLSLFLYGVAMFFASFPPTTSAAALQLMAPNQMRAQVTALFFVSMNFFGITGGSLLVALCTDYLFKNEVAVGYSMSLIGSLSGLIGAIVLILGASHFKRTADKVDMEARKIA